MEFTHTRADWIQLQDFHCVLARAWGRRDDGQVFAMHATIPEGEWIGLSNESFVAQCDRAKERVLARLMTYSRDGCYCRMVAYKSNRYEGKVRNRQAQCPWHTKAFADSWRSHAAGDRMDRLSDVSQ